jgi:hypothetical protein
MLLVLVPPVFVILSVMVVLLGIRVCNADWVEIVKHFLRVERKYSK